LTEDDLRALLIALGATPDEVSATLLAAGHRGVRDNTWSCPIAEYLRSHGAADVQVEPDRVELDWDSADSGINDWVSVRLPPAARAFVISFDAGAYPDLVLPDEGVTP
jgi:hypothetical protein